MIYCKRARKEDLPAIRLLLQETGKMLIDEKYLTPRDIAIQARDSDTGEVVGFLWCGVMAGNSLGYLDKFQVAQSRSRQGIGNLMAKAMLAEVKRRGIRQVFGMIQQDEFHDKSAFNALKMAMASDGRDYTLVFADLPHVTAELAALGA